MKNFKEHIEELGFGLEKCGENWIGIKNGKGNWISFINVNSNQYYSIVASFDELNQETQGILTNILENYILKNEKIQRNDIGEYGYGCKTKN